MIESDLHFLYYFQQHLFYAFKICGTTARTKIEITHFF